MHFFFLMCFSDNSSVMCGEQRDFNTADTPAKERPSSKPEEKSNLIQVTLKRKANNMADTKSTTKKKSRKKKRKMKDS